MSGRARGHHRKQSLHVRVRKTTAQIFLGGASCRLAHCYDGELLWPAHPPQVVVEYLCLPSLPSLEMVERWTRSRSAPPTKTRKRAGRAADWLSCGIEEETHKLAHVDQTMASFADTVGGSTPTLSRSKSLPFKLERHHSLLCVALAAPSPMAMVQRCLLRRASQHGQRR